MELKCDDISFSYKNKVVLDNLSLHVSAGENVGIVGSNGSGKTTLLKIICGMLKPNKGNIIFDYKKDKKITGWSGVIETPHFWEELSGKENLKYYLRDKYDEDKAELYFEKLKLKTNENIKLKNYSLGMKQKLALILSIITPSELLLFDEPTNSLDIDSTDIFYEILREEKSKGRSAIVVSHVERGFYENCDRVFKLCDGKLNCDNTNNVLKINKKYVVNFSSAMQAQQAIALFSEKEIEMLDGDTLILTLYDTNMSKLLNKLSQYDIRGISEKNELEV